MFALNIRLAIFAGSRIISVTSIQANFSFPAISKFDIRERSGICHAGIQFGDGIVSSCFALQNRVDRVYLKTDNRLFFGVSTWKSAFQKTMLSEIYSNLVAPRQDPSYSTLRLSATQYLSVGREKRDVDSLNYLTSAD